MAQQDSAQDQGNAKGYEISPANINKPSSLPSKKFFPSWITVMTGKESNWCEIFINIVQQRLEIFQFVEFNPFFYLDSHQI